MDMIRERNIVGPLAGSAAMVIAVGAATQLDQQAAAWLIMVAAVAAIAAVAVPLRPWWRSPVTAAQRQAALKHLPPALVERGRKMSAALVWSTWTLLAVRLATVPLLIAAGTPAADWVSDPGQPWYLRAGLATLVLAGAVAVLEATPMWWDTRCRGTASTKVAGPAGLNTAIGVLAGTVFWAVKILGLAWAMHLWPSGWWLALIAAYAAARLAARMLLEPGTVQSAASGGKPVTSDRLRQRVAAAAAGAGLRSPQILVVEKPGPLNAVVGGVGRQKITVFGPGLAETTDDETARPATGVEDEAVAIATHEVAHVRYGDGWLRMLTGTAQAGFTLAVLVLAGNTPGLLHLAGVVSLADPHAVGLILAVLTVPRLIAVPVQTWLNRAQERRADQYALHTTGEPHTVASAWQRALREVGGDPNPGPSYLLWPKPAGHPVLAERLATALAFDPPAARLAPATANAPTTAPAPATDADIVNRV
ncbi:M48 family metalloprotease [Nucisporomicrobium flavum]|uniref:M48 family metalloprotease n=1 Tax=Nucisporomicrobium flavum TaxID=2785915 RepID=UPI0018F34D47|nr:M48 family metalloprotease [Nucisporomicrobium flavum]